MSKPDDWTLPKGGWEVDESERDCALREACVWDHISVLFYNTHYCCPLRRSLHLPQVYNWNHEHGKNELSLKAIGERNLNENLWLMFRLTGGTRNAIYCPSDTHFACQNLFAFRFGQCEFR